MAVKSKSLTEPRKVKPRWQPQFTDEEIRNSILADMKVVADQYGALMTRAAAMGLVVNSSWSRQEDGTFAATITCALKL